MKAKVQNQSDRRLHATKELKHQTCGNIVSQNQKIINFRGDVKNNIQQILSGITCCRNCQFGPILTIFANKIQKLRYERDILKGRYIDDISELKTQARLLEEEILSLRERLDSQEKQQTFITERESYQIETESDDRKNEYEQYLLITSTIKRNLIEQNQLQGSQRKKSIIQKSQLKSKDQAQKQKYKYNSQKQKDSRYIEADRENQPEAKEKGKCLKSINDIEKIRLKYNISQESVENYLREYILTQAEQISDKKNLTYLYQEMIRSKQRKLAKESVNYALQSVFNKQNNY